MSSTASAVGSVFETPVALEAVAAARRRARSTEWNLLIAALLVNDLLMVGLGFRVAYAVRFELPLPFFHAEALSSIDYYARLVVYLIPIWLAVLAAAGAYQRAYLLGGTEEYDRVFRGTTLGVLVVAIAGFLVPELIVARGWIVLAWGFTFVFTSAGRLIIRRIVYGLRARGHFLSRALIVGANEEARLLADQLLMWRTSGLKLVGFVDGEDSVGKEMAPNLRVIGSIAGLDSIVARHGVEELILASSALSRETILDIFRRYGVSPNLQLRMSSGLYEIITTGLSVKEFAYVPLVGVNRVRLTGTDRLIKASLDYAVTLPLLLLLSPLLLILGLLIRLDSPGPLIHRRRVLGINGRQFDAYKFRTMAVNGDEILAGRPELHVELAQNHKLKDDPRVTRLGRILRRFSLDELPQLFNVLKRDMSLVGPRMISPEEMARYDQWGINLLTIPPGITGLWQVSGRSDIGYAERVRLDMHYVRNWSIWLDLQLLWQTIPAVLRGRGAY
ncbi:MAG TPA: sugar transferase [Anaerolineales bacterium]|nr:sugar transferase [Anaerolineales bacterium]